jgi:hypothetical protein
MASDPAKHVDFAKHAFQNPANLRFCRKFQNSLLATGVSQLTSFSPSTLRLPPNLLPSTTVAFAKPRIFLEGDTMGRR